MSFSAKKGVWFWPVILGYGFFAAFTYESLKLSGPSPLAALPIISWMATILLIPFVNWKLVIVELKPANILRPLIFSIGQLLVAGALQFNSTFSTFYSTAIGLGVSLVVGTVFLKEWPNRLSTIGLVLVIGCVYANQSAFGLTYLAIAAGTVQGLGVILARRRALSGANPLSMAFSGMVVLALLSSIGAIASVGFANESYLFNYKYLFISGAGFAVLQLSYCYLTKKVSGWVVSLSANSRVPASVFIALVFGRNSYSPSHLINALFIVLGMALVFYGQRKQNIAPPLVQGS